jgi:hypothetical protein
VRRPLALLVLLGLAAAQENDPFKGDARDVVDAAGRVKITVPKSWTDADLSGTIVIHIRAPLQRGGHDLLVTREEGQSDVDKQRDRYLQYDGGRFPGADVQKLSEPFFGYRIQDAKKNEVLVRAFADDGADGIVVSVMSRHQNYDAYHRELIEAVVASLAPVKGADAKGEDKEDEGLRRVHDEQGRVSIVVPALWKPVEAADGGEWLAVALKGAKTGPRLAVRNWGGPSSAALTLTKLFTQWKRVYAGVTSQILEGEPPRMLVQGRVEGSLDYLIAFENRNEGYTLQLTVREGSYEKLRDLADQVAKTLVFADAPWAAPDAPEGAPAGAYRKEVAVHAAAGLEEAAAGVVKALPAFAKAWAAVGLGDAAKKPPLAVSVVPEERFAAESGWFGGPPCAYDRSRRVVAILPPPPEDEGLGLWRGRLYAALAEAALHRDLPSPPPPWLRAGLLACMDAAGQSGSPEEGHPAHASRLTSKVAADGHRTLKTVLATTNADLLGNDAPDATMYAWGYTHLFLFGKGTPSNVYRRWVKDVEKGKETTPLDLGPYERVEQDLKEHVLKRWPQ